MKNKLLLLLATVFFAWGHILAQPFKLLKDIWPGSNGSEPGACFAVGNSLYFSAMTNDAGVELWKTDGTSAGTVMVKDIYPGSEGSYIDHFVNYNGLVYFSAYTPNGGQLWKTDGTTDGTVVAASLCSGCDAAVSPQVVFNGLLYIIGNTNATGSELWSYDGTSVQMLMDLHPGSEGGVIDYLGIIDDHLYFLGNDGVHGYGIWSTDGTPAGTQMVKVIPSAVNPAVELLGTFNGLIYFSAHDGTNGQELWRTDGTETGTFMLKDINPGVYSSYPGNSVELNGTVYFIASTQSGGTDIFKTDGTVDGTEALLPPPAAPGSRYYSDLAKMGNRIYFFGEEPGSGHGRELYKTDGTVAGTVLVKDINPGSADGATFILTAIGNTVYLNADDGAHGAELWRSDGTGNGTTMVQELEPGSDGSEVIYITQTDTRIFIIAYTSAYGAEWWVSDFTISLPLNLLAFEGAVSGKDARLWWKTTDEQYIRHIVLERSSDGIQFIPVTKLAPNNTPGEHVYEYTDLLDPVAQGRMYFYRLKTVDLDGSSRYSRIIRLNWRGDNQVLAYPNPVTGKADIHIKSRQAITRWSVSDARGVVLNEGITGALKLMTIPGKDLEPGIYFLRLDLVDGERIVKPLVVQ